MAKISLWLKDLLSRTPGAIRTVVRQEFKQAVREFYERSACLRETVLRDVTAAEETYQITPDTAGLITQRILAVSYDETPLRPLSARPPGRYQEGVPRWWFTSLTEVGGFNVWPRPVDALEEGFSIYIAMVPDPELNTLPAISETDHYEALLDGTLARLKMQVGKPYTDMVGAAAHRQKFMLAIGNFAAQGKKGNITEVGAWAFPRFGK